MAKPHVQEAELAWSKEDAARIASGVGMRVRTLKNSSEGGKHYKAGDEGFVLGPSTMGSGRFEVLFDKGCTANPSKDVLELICPVGARVIASCDSSDGGKYYKAGDAGIFLGASNLALGRASVMFESTRKVENPHCSVLVLATAEVHQPNETDEGTAEPRRRVFLMRHAQAELDVTSDTVESDQKDALLTEVGRNQASSWSGHVSQFGAEAVLISPLRRALQTACLAFASEQIPMQVCSSARERRWDRSTNQLSDPEVLQELLKDLPRGSDVSQADAAMALGLEEPTDEEAAIGQLREILLQRLESSILVVTHGDVIKELCSAELKHCEVLECALSDTGTLQAIGFAVPPWSTVGHGHRIRAVKDGSKEGIGGTSVLFDAGSEGFCVGPSETNANEISVLFDTGMIASLQQDEYTITFEAGSNVMVKCDSSDSGKYYKAGDTGVFMGASEMDFGRASVMFHRTGQLENPQCVNLQAVNNAAEECLSNEQPTENKQ